MQQRTQADNIVRCNFGGALKGYRNYIYCTPELAEFLILDIKLFMRQKMPAAKRVKKGTLL